MPTIYDRFGREAVQPSAEEFANLRTVIDATLASKGRVLTLDMREPAHRNHVLSAFGGEEHLGKHFPNTLAVVNATQRAHEQSGGPTFVSLLQQDEPATDEWSPLVNILYCNLGADGQTVVAGGIATLTGLATSMTLTMQIIDNNTSGSVTVAVPAQFNTKTQVVETSLAVTSPVNATALLTAAWLPAGATSGVQSTAAFLLSGPNAVSSVNVVDPNHNNHPNNAYIKVALNRDSSQQPDADYWYQYGASGPQPIVGLAVNGSAQLVAGVSVGSPPNFGGTCILQRRSSVGDGACIAIPAANIPALCQGSGGTVSWTIGPNWFQGAPWDQNQTIDLDFNLNFALSPPGGTSVRVTSIPITISPLPPNVGQIMPMLFVWGCLAAGTPVRAAGGALRPVETFVAGDDVITGSGATARVVKTWTGFETKPLMRLIANGAELLVTDEHPVATPGGMRRAGELRAGDRVVREDGVAALTCAERAGGDEPVYNLELAHDPARDDESASTFVAAGFVVGDNRLQGVYAPRDVPALALDDEELLLAALPAEWHADARNASRLARGLDLVPAPR